MMYTCLGTSQNPTTHLELLLVSQVLIGLVPVYFSTLDKYVQGTESLEV